MSKFVDVVDRIHSSPFTEARYAKIVPTNSTVRYCFRLGRIILSHAPHYLPAVKRDAEVYAWALRTLLEPEEIKVRLKLNPNDNNDCSITIKYKASDKEELEEIRSYLKKIYQEHLKATGKPEDELTFDEDARPEKRGRPRKNVFNFV